MGWDASGRLVVDGVPVENTNVLDLVHSVTRPRKVAAPAGAHIFLKTLAEINTPTELVPNAKFLRFKQTPKFLPASKKRAAPTPRALRPRKMRQTETFHTPSKSIKGWKTVSP